MKEFNNFVHIATATTTVVKEDRGTLKRITLNEQTAGIIKIFDNNAGSGTVLAIIPAATPAQTLEYDCVMGTGITVVTAGADDLTVIFSD